MPVHCSSLSPLTKDLVKARQCYPVPDIVVLVHALNGLLAALLTNLDFLHPALDVLLGSELEHLLHLGSVANVRRAHVAAVGGKDLGGHGWERVVGEADHVEGAVDLEDGEVFCKVELVGGIGGVDDEVEVELPWLGPALVLGNDEVLGSHLQSVVLLVGAMRDDVGVGAHGDGPEDTKVTETSALAVLVTDTTMSLVLRNLQSNDADLLSRARS